MHRRVTIEALSCAAALWTALSCDSAAAQSDAGNLTRLIDEAVPQAGGACRGLAIGIKKGTVRAQRFYGVTGHGGRPGPDTEFEIGSITKTFTATLLAWADRQGRMHIDDPLAKYVPPDARVPLFNGQPIRLAHLAEHTAGLPRKMPTPGPRLMPPAVWEFLSNYQLTRPPGAQFLYSNLGYGILALAIVRTYGQRLEPLIASVITRPLGMHDTAINLGPAQHARLAQGFGPKGNPAPENTPGFPAMNGAGAVRSTLNDMMRYLDFELGETRSPLNSLLPVTHQVRHPAGPHGSVGLGWQMQMLASGQPIILKDGAMPGYASFMVFAPSTHTGAVILSNQARCPVRKIGATLINALNDGSGQPPDVPPSEDEDD
jgi:CubicO group peptidase (beta-lactamase class C family)